jgi:hypothetical protein
MSSAPAINLAGLFPNASTGLLDVIKQLQQAQNKANTANEQRYQDILGQYSNLGQAGMTQIGQQEQQGLASNTQGMISRGLSNTTVGDASARGISSDAELKRQQLQEGVAQQKAGVMERRTDQGPDMGMYANLLQKASQSQNQNFNWHTWAQANPGKARERALGMMDFGRQHSGGKLNFTYSPEDQAEYTAKYFDPNQWK